jgi:hypothetical protein
MKGGVNIDTKSLIFKLQKALKSKGIIVCINTSQFYSEQQDRYITMYTVVRNKKQLIRTASQIKVISVLQEIWKEASNNEE